MGIGRREFLKLFGATILTAAANPLQAIVCQDDFYINRALGIAFEKPPGWHYMAMKEFPQLKDEQVLKNDVFREDLLSATDPMVILTREDPDLEEGLTPAITVYVEPFKFGPGETLQGVCRRLQIYHKKALKDYKVTTEPVSRSISRCDALEYKSSFLFETHKLKAVARHRSVIIVRDPQAYTVNMFDYPAEQMDAQSLFDAFIASIYLV